MKKIVTLVVPALALAIAAPAFANDQNQANTANSNTSSGLSATFVINDKIDEFYQENGPVTLNETVTLSFQHNDNTKVLAIQDLYAENTNKYLDEVVDLDGEDESSTAVGYNSGNNHVNDSAFAAFAGILNQAWNTGINANTQAASNIAAQGTVNFGSIGDDDDGE